MTTEPPAPDPASAETLPQQGPGPAGPPAMEQYRIVRQVGRGGMGVVYEAEDLRLNRRVALKFLKGGDDEELARFRREAQLAGSLAHPNIAAIYEAGEASSGPFIAMQFIEGRTLEKFPRGDRRLLARLVRDAARALSYAHSRDVVHRDLKPGNLIVEQQDPAGGEPSSSFHIYILDFGLARSIEGASSLSLSGIVVGTPAYMAPEQARGERVDGRADIYSLGATLYELLTGRAPFQGANVYEIMRKAVEEEPERPRAVDASIDRDLETIVLKCLEKNPARRYATGGELAEDLERHLQGDAVRARPPSLVYRVRKSFSKRKAAVLAVVATAAALVTAAGFLHHWLGSRTQVEALKELGSLWTQVVMAKQGFHNATEDPRRVRTRIEGALARVDDYILRHPDQPQGHYIRARGLLYLDRFAEAERSFRESIRREPGFIPGQALLARVLLDRVLWTQFEWYDPRSYRERFDRARVPLEEAGRLLAKAWTGDAERNSVEQWGLVKTPEDDISETVVRAMSLMFIQHDEAGAARLLREADAAMPFAEYSNLLGCLQRDPAENLRFQDRALEQMPHFARARMNRGAAHYALGHLEEAIADYRAGIRISPDLAMLHTSLGQALHDRKEYDAAIEEYSRALEIDGRGVRALNGRGIARFKLNQLDAAEADYSRAIEYDPKFALAYSNRGAVRRLRPDFDGALRDLDSAIDLDPGDAKAYTCRGEIRRILEDLDRAIADLDRAAELDPTNIMTFIERGSAHANKGDYERAFEDFSRALAIDDRNPTALALRANLWMLQGDFDRAIADLDHAIQVDPLNIQAYLNRGVVRAKRGDIEGAIKDFNRMLEIEPRNAEALGNRAIAYGKQRKYDLGIADCDRAIGFDPRKPNPHVTRGDLLRMKGDAAGAMESYDRALAVSPGYAPGYMNRGLARLAGGDGKGAAADFRKALEVAPPRWPERVRVGRLLEQLQKGQKPKDEEF